MPKETERTKGSATYGGCGCRMRQSPTAESCRVDLARGLNGSVVPRQRARRRARGPVYYQALAIRDHPTRYSLTAILYIRYGTVRQVWYCTGGMYGTVWPKREPLGHTGGAAAAQRATV